MTENPRMAGEKPKPAWRRFIWPVILGGAFAVLVVAVNDPRGVEGPWSGWGIVAFIVLFAALGALLAWLTGKMMRISPDSAATGILSGLVFNLAFSVVAFIAGVAAAIAGWSDRLRFENDTWNLLIVGAGVLMAWFGIQQFFGAFLEAAGRGLWKFPAFRYLATTVLLVLVAMAIWMAIGSILD